MSDKKITCDRHPWNLYDMLELASPHICRRYLDPKNVVKGSHRELDPIKHYRWIQHEALESLQAYRNNEGDDREIEELSDVILLSLMRIENIIKNERGL